MNRHIVHYAPGGQSAEPPSWHSTLERHLFIFLRATSATQIRYYAGSFPLAGVLIDLVDPPGESAAELVREAATGLQDQRTPLIGLSARPPGPEVFHALARAGMNGFHAADWPDELLVHPLRSFQALAGLAELERTGMNAKRLAEESRKILHDMSQPLAALQGRLQMMDYGATDDDPAKKQLSAMVIQVFQVTEQLRRLHELTRKHS